jgi:hypothetical protein
MHVLMDVEVADPKEGQECLSEFFSDRKIRDETSSSGGDRVDYDRLRQKNVRR